MDSLTGKLLVAMPSIGDPRFDRAVILLCGHDAEHAMGIILNKPRPELTIADVLAHLEVIVDGPVAQQAVLDGGPVKPDRGFVLHSNDFGDDDSQDVAPGVRLSVTRDVLEALATPAHPRRLTLALGYSGWGAGQLEAELAHNAWLVAEPDDAIVFGEAHETKWAAALRQIGVQPGMLSGDMGHA